MLDDLIHMERIICTSKYIIIIANNFIYFPHVIRIYVSKVIYIIFYRLYAHILIPNSVHLCDFIQTLEVEV